MLIRQAFADGAKQAMTPYATGSNLDQPCAIVAVGFPLDAHLSANRPIFQSRLVLPVGYLEEPGRNGPRHSKALSKRTVRQLRNDAQGGALVSRRHARQVQLDRSRLVENVDPVASDVQVPSARMPTLPPTL